ncbi:hypothetical protein GCM10029964_092450 [Kibdelosporangium lantanae]
MVYAYLRLGGGGWGQRREAVTQRLLEFCAAHRLLLCAVFTEMNVNELTRHRPAFDELLDHCRQTTPFAVVVPSRDHLSAYPTRRATMTRDIVECGTDLIIANQ